ncbi:hypothetical protein [Actinophytocola sp.]|uniref:hypothetical protein n=1 Tax=Actinophytocola sp. TaxID=1872138 RepID=UPI002ED1575A
MRRRFSALIVALLLTGCGAGRAEPNSVTESEAYDRVESYVRRAAEALPSEAQLQSAAPPSSVACEGEPERVMVTSTYWVRGVVSEDRHFDSLLTWWESHGFELLDDLRPERHYVWVESASDGFRMSLRDNEKGELLLSAESPCLTAE